MTIRLAVNLHRAYVHVHDTGIGIDAVSTPDCIRGVYTSRRIDRTQSRRARAWDSRPVKGVVELHGGSVTAASEGTNKGTAVTVELPLADPAEAGLQPPSTDQPSIRLRRVLIIEDNADSADSLRQYLEFHGHTVSVAQSGADGLTLAATFEPDVVVCDVGLPGMDGYAVATELRRMTSPPELIIAVSGHGPRKMPGGHPDTVFDYYLLKPADPARVSRLLSAEIARQ